MIFFLLMLITSFQLSCLEYWISPLLKPQYVSTGKTGFLLHRSCEPNDLLHINMQILGPFVKLGKYTQEGIFEDKAWTVPPSLCEPFSKGLSSMLRFIAETSSLSEKVCKFICSKHFHINFLPDRVPKVENNKSIWTSFKMHLAGFLKKLKQNILTT